MPEDLALWVQVGAAAASVLVTIVLAAIAALALRAANRQAAASHEQAVSSRRAAEAASAAAEEARRQGYHAVVPLLNVGQPHSYEDQWSGFRTLVRVENVSDVPALSVWVEFYGDQGGGHLTAFAAARSSQTPLLPADTSATLDIPSGDVKNMDLLTSEAEQSWHDEFGTGTPPRYIYDRFVIRVHCRGIRGASVVHEWAWHANHPRQAEAQVWQQLAIRIWADPDSPEVVEVTAAAG